MPDDGARTSLARGPAVVTPSARVLSVNISAGGVPKLPVGQAQVGRFGLEGDGHREDTVHGGPYRAVCLFAMEVIERLQAEGHPVEPGSVGENLTTVGVEWSTLAPGTQARIGERLVIELTGDAGPCSTQRPNFSDGRVARISILTHPSDSRMYARVVSEGVVRPGDPIELLPLDPAGEGAMAQSVSRVDAAWRKSDLRLWEAARAGDSDIRIVDDGDLAIAATPDVPGPAFNQAHGLRELVNLLPRVLDFYREHGTPGWLPMTEQPWPGAQPDYRLAVVLAEPDGVAHADLPAGVSVRVADEADAPAIQAVLSGAHEDAQQGLLLDVVPVLLGSPGRTSLIAEDGGRAIATASLQVHHHVGFLRGMHVVPDARGRGLQRALIATRARLAVELGCDLVASTAEPDSISETNLAAMGLERVGIRDVYRFDPTAPVQVR
jgi:MOSC domain-containing protein YiiM/N-acetylglutamate synthase-like GNAT family acetyltransferase